MTAPLRLSALLATAALAAVALAGCSGGDGGGGPGDGTEPPLASGKGAISGLVINDVYRPVPGALVLLQPAGLTATSDASGQFSFLDMEPGAYILRVQADGHEAAPGNVDVVEGEYAEAELIARRVFNEAGAIITTEYSVFVPCAFSAPVVTANPPCLLDQSGDTDRFSFYINYTDYEDRGITYLVTEMKADRPASQEPGRGAYKVVVRSAEDTSQYYGSAFTVDSDYIRIVMPLGQVSAQDTEGRNHAWNNTEEMQVALFPQGSLKTETQQGMDAACSVDPSQTACGESRGLGFQLGVRAKFVQSLFLGEPEVAIDSYCVLC